MSKSIEEITPKEMVAEMHRRGKSAVMFVFDRPADGNYSLHEVAGVSINCHGSDDMSEDQLRLVVQSIAKIAAVPPGTISEKQSQNSELYELKGDRLGMSLSEFKQKYHRIVPGQNKTAPYSSDQQQNTDAGYLLAEEWHRAANIVHCSIEFPFERLSGVPGPTVAGVEAQRLVYKFVDGQLFQITGCFNTRDFEKVKQGVLEKYGEAHYQEKKPILLIWSNGVSTISLIRGRISPKEFSVLQFSHDELLEVVRARSPIRVADL